VKDIVEGHATVSPQPDSQKWIAIKTMIERRNANVAASPLSNNLPRNLGENSIGPE
jgi:hypothetical protein